MPTKPAPHIVIAGASGYIGMAIMPRLLERFPGATITAIARGPRPSSDPRISWRACDLFSLKSLEEALPSRIDLAIYLVHSMGPTAHLDQGSFMICPHWTQTLTSPVDLPTVLSAIASASLQPEHVGKIYDLAGCRPLTYVQMMRETASKLGKKRRFLPVPFFTPTLSRLWVSLITNSPRNLV